jgi:mediator of RNA polymerase II transcription subunit 13
VDFIPGFAAIHYWVYTAEPAVDSSKVTDEKSLDDALFEAEIASREQKLILYYDEQRKALWFFSGATAFPAMPPSAVTDGSTGIEKYGWQFKIIFSGMFKAAEIGIHPARFAAMYSPGSLSAGGQLQTPPGVVSAASNPRAFQQNTAGFGPLSLNGTVSLPYDRNDVRSIYGFFMKGVQACFAFTLAKEHKALQMDSTSYIEFPERWSSSTGDDETALPSPVFAINQSLANGGGMLVSTSLVGGMALSPHEVPPQAESTPTEVIIAPGGSSAEVLLNAIEEQESGVHQWKALVREQLRARGIKLDSLDPQDRWILLKTSEKTVKGGEGSTESTVFYWPQSLCFTKHAATPSTFRGISLRSALSQQSTDLSWFLPPHEGGNQEPVSFAQNWYDGKAAREQAVQDRRRQEELQKKQLEASTLGVTSPAYPRDGLQATAGVYPTPPDGIPHGNHVHGPQDAQNLPVPVNPIAHRSSLDMQHSEMMDLDIGPFEDNVRQRPSVVSRNSLDGVVKLAEDDLFGDDLVDEDLRGQDITDADFSFFDEPEGDDAMMLDDIEEEAEEANAEEGDNVHVEDFAHLGDATNGVNLVDEKSAGIIQSRKSISSHRPETAVKDTPHTVDHGDDIPMDDPNAAAPKQNGVHEPLSPSAVRKKLFDFAITPADVSRRRSQFQPLAFNTMMQVNDAKYSMDGAFAFRMQGSQTGEGRSATSPYIKPRPPDHRRRLSIHPGASLTSPDQARYYDSDSSSDVSETSDEDSVSGYGTRSIVSSSTRARLNDGAGSGGDDVQSMAGTTMTALEEFNIDVMVSCVCDGGFVRVLTIIAGSKPSACKHSSREAALYTSSTDGATAAWA